MLPGPTTEEDMSREAVLLALEAMLDDGLVADRLARGDFAAVEGLDLDDHERSLVRGAAADLPEVAGFSAGPDGGLGAVTEALRRRIRLDYDPLKGPHLTSFAVFGLAADYGRGAS